jgi:hypothetical protein
MIQLCRVGAGGQTGRGLSLSDITFPRGRRASVLVTDFVRLCGSTPTRHHHPSFLFVAGVGSAGDLTTACYYLPRALRSS